MFYNIAGKYVYGGKMRIEDREATEEEIALSQQNSTQHEITMAIQNLLDTTAQAKRYDNMMSARSYAGYANPFQEEALKLASWGASCWAKAGEIEIEVVGGLRPMPTVAEALAEMPQF